MKKILLFLFDTVFMIYGINAQDYYINFAGTGASNNVSAVSIKNLTTDDNITIFGNQVLHLTNKIASHSSWQNKLNIYPNPVTGNHALVQIHPPYSGEATIRISDLSGKINSVFKTHLGNYTQIFRLSGLNNGFYFINVRGMGYRFSGKIMWNGTTMGNIELVKISDNSPWEETITVNNYSAIPDTLEFKYSYGDRLKFIGRSENYSTIVMDIPSSNKTITFPFYPCTDDDKNNYTIVEIGSQIWMAENLMTTKYNNATAIFHPGTDYFIWNNDTTGAYTWYNNDEGANKKIYGALYNWYSINSRILCPCGWHIPNDSEWMILRDYLGGSDIAGEKIKDTGTAFWNSPNIYATNETGYSALPGGFRDITGFRDIGQEGNWWSSTFYRNYLKPSVWHLSVDSKTLDKKIADSANEGFSVRCIMGESGFSVPFVVTNEIINISATSATGVGMIISDEGSDIIDKGFCWNTSEDPTIEDQNCEVGTGEDMFYGNINGLEPGTLYFARAYATNKAGTSYGENVTFTTQATLPELNTSPVSNVTQTSVTSGGEIIYDGGGSITERGVCWALSIAPTVSDFKLASGTGTGSFVSNITGLRPGTTYYLRAYAINEAGTAYGNEQTFNTIVALASLNTATVTNITHTSATSGGNISDNGGGAVTDRGVCWSTSRAPTIDNSKTSDGTGIGSFVSNITGLEPGTTYYVRAYATNSAGTMYGEEMVFSTLVALPELTTSSIINVTQTTAESGGHLTSDGGGNITDRGICISTHPNPTLNDIHFTGGSGAGSFIVTITELQPGTTYHVRAYATNSAGTAYGNDISFTTLADLPELTTTEVSAITTTTATSGGNISSNGGGTITARGVCWATSPAPDISDSRTINGTGTGTFISDITELQPGTTYYVRAYATNSAGTAYGNEIAFATQVALPVLTTAAITNIRQTTATSGGNITNDGGGTVTERGVCWSTNTNPTINNSKTTNGSGTGSFSADITGLIPLTTYHVRAYAINNAGTAYGNEITFTTLSELPVLSTSAVTGITQTSATSGGNITDDGGRTITERGLCWATTANPSTSDSKILSGSGTGSFSAIITGLQPGTTYHVRAYATNSAGTSYGNQVSFTTIPDAAPTVYFTAPGNNLLLHSVNNKRIIYTQIGSDYYIRFSSNNGDSYNQGVKVTNIFNRYNKARILTNGNIVLFCVNKIYYSDDNMNTIHPCNALNKDGSAYVLHTPVNPDYPGDYFNFMGGFAEKDGVCLLGNYTNSALGASPINLYYSLDGITWKVMYTFGQNPNRTDNGTSAGGTGGILLGDPNNPIITRHIHAINIGEDGNFYVCTGDVSPEMQFLKCSYNSSSDNWIINALLSGASTGWQRMRALGVYERNGYLYWGSDGPGTFVYGGVTYQCHGIYKSPVSSINNPATHVLLEPLDDSCYSFYNQGNLVFAGLQSLGYIYISFDYGETWMNFPKPSWMTGTVEGIWFNDLYDFFGTSTGVIISSSSF